MEYKEYKPCKHLSLYVECYWSAYSDKPPFREKESLIPDGTIELMFNFGEDYSQIKDEQKSVVKGSHIIGIRRQSLVISQTGKQNFFCIRFKLGGTYPFFKIPVHLFANDFYTLQDLFGNEFRELEEQLFDALDNTTRVAITEKYLLRKLRHLSGEYSMVSKCIHEIRNSATSNIKELSVQYNTNYKTLERRFNNIMGLTPAELIKINRFNNAVLLMYSCRFDSLTNIAYECGYYDQSHFIREFRQLTNFSPKEFLKEQFTIVQVIQPALAERMSKSYNF
ncbi:MAG TPA: AraC family transcriptional regulator [Flavipsychrobacter sp.]|nr:AraC family transcriptional regulator [Flavipsychrobacter sp.]